MEDFDDEEDAEAAMRATAEVTAEEEEEAIVGDLDEAEEKGVAGYMLSLVDVEWDFFSNWKI